MQRFFFLIILLMAGMASGAQPAYYDKAVAAYKAQKTDSAWWYIDRAIQHYRDTRQTDSLVLAYVQKADMAWYEESVQRGLSMIDTAIRLSQQLPYQSVAAVAALNKCGQIHTNNSAANTGKRYFMQALDRIPANAPPHDTYASLYTNIAWMYLVLQELDNGIVYGEKARQMIETMHGKDARMLTSVFQTLMYLAHDATNYAEAEKYGLEMYRLADKHLPALHTSRALAHNDLGTLYETMYRSDEALYHRQQMVRIIQVIYQRNKNPHLLSIAYNNMGRLYENLGEWQLANEYYEKGCRLHALNYGPEGVGMVRPLAHLANVRRSMGRFEEADSLFRRSLRIQQQQEPDDKLNFAYVETLYGDLFYDRQQYQEAAGYYQRALQHQQSGNNDKASQATRTTLGQVYIKQGRFKEGLALLEQCLGEYRLAYPPGHIVIAGQLNKISEAWLDHHDPSTAMRYSDSTFLELLQLPRFPAGNWVEKLPYYHFVLNYLKHRTNIENALFKKDGDRSRLQHIQQLADDYGAYLEKILPALRTQASLVQLAAQHKHIYNAAIEACWLMHEKDSNGAWLEKAFAYSERSRGLLLRLASNNILIDAGQGLQQDSGNKDFYWRKRISELNARYLDAGRKNDSLLTQLTIAMESYYRFQDSLVRSGNAPARMKYRLKPLSIREIREQLLNHGETLLQYAVTDDAVFVFVLNERQFTAKRLSRTVLNDVKELRHLYGLSAQSFVQPAFRLYQQLVAPAEPLLLKNRLLIMPDADLYYLNFELLVSSDKQTAFGKLPYLLLKYDISTQLSATSAIQYKAALRQAADKALLLAPVFTDEMKAAYRQEVKDSLLTDQQYLTLLRQPFALSAARQIGQYIKTDLFSGPAALERTFKQTAAGYTILHLGTHAEINNLSPLQSRFFLAKPSPGDSTDNDDGYLHAYEIYGMQLQADLAVLTACETGLGEWNQGEGVISLAHSFMYAGCPSVVMTLWKVDEKTSAEIITLFYKHLAAGKSKSEALRAAKLDYLHNAPPELSHPYFWAGMTLIGDDMPVVSSFRLWWWIGGVAAALAIGGIALSLRRRSKKS